MAERPAKRDRKVSLPYFRALVDSIAEPVSATINRYWYVVAALLTIVYFADGTFRASRKLLWFDEIFTLSVSRLPDLRTLWRVLTAGIEFNPPLLYVLTGFSNRVFGESPVSTRLPEIVGFWVFCICLFRFVSKRTSPLAGFVSMLFPMVTPAYWYAYEARPYGIEMGLCGIALVCWQGAADRVSKRLPELVGLWFGLAGALLAHSYAFLVFIPLVLGELARTKVNRRMDWPIWAAIAAACPAVLASIPLLAAFRAIIVPAIMAHPSAAGLVTSYIISFKPAAYVLIGWLALMYLSNDVPRTGDEQARSFLPFHEMVALLAFLAIPAVQSVVAKVTGGPPIARYSIFWIAAPACLLGLASARKPVVALGTLCILLAQIGANALNFSRSTVLIEPSSGYPIDTSLAEFTERYRWMEAGNAKTLPVALLSKFDFLPTAYYAPPGLASRLTYVMTSKPDLINGTFYARLRPCCGDLLGPPVFLADFIGSHDTFLAYGGPPELHVIEDLVKGGASVTLRNISPEHFLVCVTLTKGPAPQ